MFSKSKMRFDMNYTIHSKEILFLHDNVDCMCKCSIVKPENIPGSFTLNHQSRQFNIYKISRCSTKECFLIGIVGGGVQLGPLVTPAIKRSIVPAPGDYDDGEIGGMIGKGNRSTLRKTLPQCCFVRHKPHMLPGRKHRPPRWEASN
jgi:hypothetical protein